MYKSPNTLIQLFETKYGVTLEQSIKDNVIFELFYKRIFITGESLFGFITILSGPNKGKLKPMYWNDVFWEFQKAKEIYDAQINAYFG
jgi:hypothetical protein